MKKKAILTSICAFIFVLILSTLFFSASLESLFKLKPNLSVIEENAFEVHFIDVGQGDCIAIKFPNNKTMLVDSGPASGRENLQEYLERIFFNNDEKVFDYVFLTHSDIDHSGNMEFILDNYLIKNFYRPCIYSKTLEANINGFKEDNVIYDNIIKKLKEDDITTYFMSDNMSINIGESLIEVFVSDKNIEETNDFSPFIIISSNESKVFLSGDAGEEYELEMIADGYLSEVDLMKLAHHGSKYSNSEELIEILKPNYVACSVGENSYGHPASEVLLRLAKFDEKYNKNTYDNFKTTLKHGNLIYYVNNDGVMSVTEILSLGKYLFVDWYLVVIIVDGVVLIYYLLKIVPKKPIKFNKHIKNMKQ